MYVFLTSISLCVLYALRSSVLLILITLITLLRLVYVDNVSRNSWDHKRNVLFGKICKNRKRGMLLQIMCFQSQLKELRVFAYDRSLRHCILYVINIKKLRGCCHVDMTANGESILRVAEDSEGDSDATGNTKWKKPGKPQRTANCHVSVVTSPNFLLLII